MLPYSYISAHARWTSERRVMQRRQWNDNQQREWEQTYYDDSDLQCTLLSKRLCDFSGGSPLERSTNVDETAFPLYKAGNREKRVTIFSEKM